MQKPCKQCAQEFEITEEDLKFYDKVSPEFGGKKYLIPEPTLCPDCRRQRRLATRNERKLYNRKCDLCGFQIISIYSPDKSCTVYCPKCWWGDKWDQFKNGRPYDFQKTFFEQYAELLKLAPRPSLHVIKNENCDYVNQCGYSKDCYLCYNTDYSQSCYFCKDLIRCKDCIDVLNSEGCELCFDSVDLKDCYHVFGSVNCKTSNNLYFCSNLISCADCFGCTNLRNKKYCFFNKQLTEEQYKEKLASHNLGSEKQYASSKVEARKLSVSLPQKFAHILQSEHSTGDYLINCKNTHDCFDSFSNQDIAHCTVTSNCKDSRDFDIGGYDCELCLEMVSSGVQNYRCVLGSNHWGNCSETLYCDLMIGDNHCFGCIALRSQKYCILNKQYTKEEYEDIVPKIIEHMKKTGEWGEFLSVSKMPFSYNETIAHEYYPLTREAAQAKGFRWKENDVINRYAGPIIEIPDNVADVNDEIIKQILTCENCKKNYKLIGQELIFYKKLNLPIPRKCFDCRHSSRMQLRNPRKLWDRTCAKCQASIKTSYAPDRPEKVYCEECYLKDVY